MLVFGTRPEAIKMAPLVKEFQKHPESFETIVCVTGQHREMLDQVLKLFEITPDYDLNIMRQGQDLYDVTARVLVGMRDVLREATPEVVLVHGDTTTSTAAALATVLVSSPVKTACRSKPFCLKNSVTLFSTFLFPLSCGNGAQTFFAVYTEY